MAAKHMMGSEPSLAMLLVIFAALLQLSLGSLKDNKDSTFVVAFPAQDARKPVSEGKNRLYITADEDAVAYIQIPSLDQNKVTRLRAGGSITIDLPGKARMSSITGIEKKGIRIWANTSVSVYGLGIVGESTDGFLALPLRLLGSEYLVPTYAPSMNAFIMVVTPHANTIVTFELKMSGNGFITHKYTNYRNGDSFTVTLTNKLDAFQLLADSSAGSLSGTRITSSIDVAVYSGNDCANVPILKGTCDHLVEQIPPISVWGRTFLVKATEQRRAGDFFHVLASQNNTRIQIETATSTIERYINARETYAFDANYSNSHVIIASQPSLVTQYAKGSSVDGSQFAPFMSIIPSTDQFSNDFTLVVPDGLSAPFIGYATIFVSTRQKSKVKITSVPKVQLPSLQWNALPNSVFSAATVQLPQAQYRFYHESPLEKLSVIFYGRGNSAAFGYPAGLRIYRPPRSCTPSSMVAADRSDNDCDGRIDEELFNSIDDDLDGRIDEDLATPIPELIVKPIANDTDCSSNNMLSIEKPFYKAHGLCNVRGTNKIVHRDISVHRSLNCWVRKTREWTFTDGCQNIIKKTQTLNVFTPSALQIVYPSDSYNQCPDSPFVDRNSFGAPNIVSQCAGEVKIEYQDSDWAVLKECGYITPVVVNRVWTVTDVCQKVFTGRQALYFKNKGSAPRIYSRGNPVVTGQEENVTLECRSSGVPKPQVSWILPDGQKLNTTHYIIETEIMDDLTQNTRLKRPQPDGSLLITDTRTVDSGLYQCHVWNVLGNDSITTNFTVPDDLVDVEASVTLPDEVFDEELLDTESDRYVDLKSTFERELTNIFMNMTGFQRVDVIGFRNGSVKVLFRVVVKTKDKTEKPSVVVKKVGKQLSVKIKGGKIGSYKVIPTAALQEKPPPPKEIKASKVKQEEAHITWSYPELHDMYAISGYLLQYRQFGSAAQPWKTYATVLGDNHRVDGLESGTSYSIRLKAKNEYGLGMPSNNLELTTQKGRSGSELALIIVIPILVLILAIVLVLCLIRRKRRGKKGFHRADMHDGQVVRYSANPQKGFQILQEDVKWKQIPRESLELGRMLGEGEFGMVIEGIVTTAEKGIRNRCAVKKLKRTATESDWKDLLNELDIMLQVGEHPNIVNLIGACSDAEGPLLVVVEYCANGSLLQYLQKNSNKNYDNLHEYVLMIPARERLRIASDVASGMVHLERMRCIHRDLAARNILLDEYMTAKVSDFGLSRDIYTSSVYEKTTGGKLPAKWMAIESIDAGLYTIQSDIWSFGIMLWEIETGGCIPYPTFTVMDMLNALKHGYRLEKPFYCAEPLYTMMLHCWSSDPALRPPFGDICDRLKQMHDVTPQTTTQPNGVGYEDMTGSDRETYA